MAVGQLVWQAIIVAVVKRKRHQTSKSMPAVSCLGLARTIYIRCIYGTFGREIIKYTVIYGVYTRFWPTLFMCPYRYRVG